MDNLTNISLGYVPELPGWTQVRTLVITLDMLLMIPICVGNILVIITYKRYTKLQTIPNLVLVNLAIIDLMTGCCSIPWTCFGVYYIYAKQYNHFLCLTNFIVIQIPLGLSGSTLLVIALMRFISVMKPLQSKSWITKKRVKITLILVWMYVSGLTTFFIYYKNTFDEGQPKLCRFANTISKFQTYTVGGHVVVILAATTSLYMYMGRLLMIAGHKRLTMCISNPSISSTSSTLSRSTNIPSKNSFTAKIQTDNSTTNENRLNNVDVEAKINEKTPYGDRMQGSQIHKTQGKDIFIHAKAIKMMGLVLVCFYLCSVPFMIRVIFLAVYKYDIKPKWLSIYEELSVTVNLMNSFVNPIIYAGLDMKFRQAFKQILHLR